MSSTAEDYEVTSANASCVNDVNKILILSTPG